MIKVMTVFGTRPEAIKMVPLLKELENNENIESVFVNSGQHKEMIDDVLSAFNVKEDYNLAIMKKGQTLTDVTVNILSKLDEVVKNENPDLILVHGDTSTAFSAALTGFYNNVRIGHVEAGLRTYDKQSPWPEEVNRCLISEIADLNFTPTQMTYDNLIRENINKANIYITGNTAIDTLSLTVNDNYEHEIIEWAKDSKLILLTAHRRENIGENMENIFTAINDILTENEDVKVVYPIHLNPRVREIADRVLKGNDRMRIIEPLNVFDFHNIIARSYIILTDSGGIQEEAPSLGIPVLVLRDTTERPEGIKALTLKLIGTDSDTIVHETNLLLHNEEEYLKMSKASNPYGDGFASKKIVNHILEYFEERN